MAGTRALATGHVSRPEVDPPTVPAELVLRLQKYKRLGSVPRPIWEAATGAATEASRLVAPEAVAWRGRLTAVDPQGTVTIESGHRFTSRVLARNLRGAREALVLILTAGPAIERRTRELIAAGLWLEGMLMDTAGWAAIEIMIRGFRLRVRDEERRAGRVVTHRLAPGYCDWPLEELLALVEVFGGAPLPVTVNESACMLPRKSISAVFGIG
jgi:hypothetical protein